MKVIVLVILSLLVSCGSPTPPVLYKDSILNYKGGGDNIKDYTYRVLYFPNTNV